MGKSLETSKGSVWALFLTTHAVLLERIETQLAQAGLPPLAWYDVLWGLERAPEQRLRMSELAEKVVLSRSNLTRLADRLADAARGASGRRKTGAGPRGANYGRQSDAPAHVAGLRAGHQGIVRRPRRDAQAQVMAEALRYAGRGADAARGHLAQLNLRKATSRQTLTGARARGASSQPSPTPTASAAMSA